MINSIKEWWKGFEERHETGSQFVMFFILSNGVTVLQLALMPILKSFLDNTDLINQSFQWLTLGTRGDGSPYYLFDYPAGALPGGGGGLSYFLAVQVTILIAQVINFFAQRNVTFKSNSSIWRAAFWYVVAYIGITIGAAFLQTLYKDPIYTLLMETWGWGATGQTIADVITMIINSAVSFWIFFPIFKVIFKRVPEAEMNESDTTGEVA
ncbi:GtrA-like protein [Ruaniaceae bacterium KH17]|nr:GtrA-like protein [Ruaniaceae bacterium KH17]